MGVILSQEPEIERLHFQPLRKGRVIKDVKVVQISDSMAIVQLANNSYSLVGNTRYLNGNVAMAGMSLSNYGAVTLQGLCKIGAISKETLDRHNKTMVERNARASKRRALKAIVQYYAELEMEPPTKIRKLAETYGVKL